MRNDAAHAAQPETILAWYTPFSALLSLPWKQMEMDSNWPLIDHMQAQAEEEQENHHKAL